MRKIKSKNTKYGLRKSKKVHETYEQQIYKLCAIIQDKVINIINKVYSIEYNFDRLEKCFFF